jgi:hypothetical protein
VDKIIVDTNSLRGTPMLAATHGVRQRNFRLRIQSNAANCRKSKPSATMNHAAERCLSG